MKYIHDLKNFPELFEKLTYETEKFGASYTAMLFEVQDELLFNTFWEFLLHYLRISDTVYKYSDTKYLVVLADTSVRGGLLLNEKLREKIKEKWFKYIYFCGLTQWDFIENHKSLEKALKKRLKIARESKTKEAIYSLSSID